MFEVIMLAALLPLSVLYSWWRFVNAPNALHPGLRKACHGAGLIALALLAAFILSNTQGIGNFLAPGLSGERLYAVIGWGLVVVVGLRLLRTGMLLSPAPLFDASGVAFGGLLKIAVGVAVYVMVWDANIGWGVPLDVMTGIASFLYMGAPYSKWAVLAVIVWCLVTGAMKFFLAVRGRRRTAKMPPAVANPRGEARNMTPAEARAAMQGTGGMKSNLDDMEF